MKVDLQGDGLLWLINRVVFHPRGFALAVVPDTGEFVLLGDGDEPWRYAIQHESDRFVNEDEKFCQVEACFARKRVTV